MPGNGTLQTARRMRPLLGTFVEVALCESRASSLAFTRAFGAIEAVQRCLSFHDPQSELSRLNASGGEFVPLSALSLRVLRAGRALSIASGGLFNYTVGGALVRAGRLPDHGGGPFIDCGSVDDVEIGAGGARLLRPVRITLDGIAKGYALDRAAGALRATGVRAGWINAGGDIRAFGDVTVPVTRRESSGALRTLGAIRDSAVATSEVRAAQDEAFGSHIVLPHAPGPALGAWTVLARRAWKADALTKVAALASPAERHERVRALGGVLIGDNRSLH